jgi:hypothetical protein
MSKVQRTGSTSDGKVVKNDVANTVTFEEACPHAASLDTQKHGMGREGFRYQARGFQAIPRHYGDLAMSLSLKIAPESTFGWQ